MKGDDLQQRFDAFVDDVITAARQIPKGRGAAHIAEQLITSSSSAGAHYREARGSESVADWLSKLAGSLREAREAEYWLGRARAQGFISAETAIELRGEANELIAILVACRVTTKKNQRRKGGESAVCETQDTPGTPER